MKRFQATLATLTLMLAISSSALAGNIGAASAQQSGTQTKGNIGAALPTPLETLAGNIGALSGNIGAVITIVLGGTTIP